MSQIWVQSPHSASGYFSIYGEDSEYNEQFSARLVTGNTNEVYARTGYLGFLRRTESTMSQAQIISESTDVSSVGDLSIASNNSFEGSGTLMFGCREGWNGFICRVPVDLQNLLAVESIFAGMYSRI